MTAKHSPHSPPTLPEASTPEHSVVIVSLVNSGFGGLEMHVLNLARQLARHGHFSLLVVPRGSRLHAAASAEGLAVEPVGWIRWVRGQLIRDWLLSMTLRRIGTRRPVSAIHCNNRFELRGAVMAARALGTATLFNYHVPDSFDTAVLRGVDSVVAVNASAADFVRGENAAKRIGVRVVECLPPILDADRLLQFDDRTQPRDWFRAHLGLCLPEEPVLCLIGNMVSDLEHKNYPLLFESLAVLRHHRNLRVQAVLVGDGPARLFLEELGGRLGLADQLHFVGHRAIEVPGILSKSDMCVLASNREAFGIVLVEAALMRRPAIAARGTGAEQIIVDGKTGVLFENADRDSLAAAIESLVLDRQRASEIGTAAFRHASRLFLPEIVLQRYLDVYAAIQH